MASKVDQVEVSSSWVADLVFLGVDGLPPAALLRLDGVVGAGLSY